MNTDTYVHSTSTCIRYTCVPWRRKGGEMDKDWPSAHITFKWVDVHWCVQHEFPCLLLPPICIPSTTGTSGTFAIRHVPMYVCTHVEHMSHHSRHVYVCMCRSWLVEFWTVQLTIPTLLQAAKVTTPPPWLPFSVTQALLAYAVSVFPHAKIFTLTLS